MAAVKELTINAMYINILFTDAAGFGKAGLLNFHNTHHSAKENPHAMRQSRYQQQFSLNIWTEILGDNLMGSKFLDGRLNGQPYFQFLRGQLHVLLEDVPLDVVCHMLFMHDGAPPHLLTH